MREAIGHAHAQGAVLVSFAGNLSLTTGPGAVAYPSVWEEVIGFAGGDVDGEGAVRTSLRYLYGEAVDFCARGDCGSEKGSSCAAARVCGLIAGLLAQGAQASGIRGMLEDMAQDMGESGPDARYGWGYLKTE